MLTGVCVWGCGARKARQQSWTILRRRAFHRYLAVLTSGAIASYNRVIFATPAKHAAANTGNVVGRHRPCLRSQSSMFKTRQRPERQLFSGLSLSIPFHLIDQVAFLSSRFILEVDTRIRDSSHRRVCHVGTDLRILKSRSHMLRIPPYFRRVCTENHVVE